MGSRSPSAAPRAPRALLAAALAVALCAVPARAQETWEPARSLRLQPTRPELEALLARAEAASREAALAPEARDRAHNVAELVRVRLRDGDFQPGDPVALEVEGETALTGTFTVSPARALVLPQVGEIPLAGVLRAEVEGRVREHLARFLRDPVARVRPLVRLAVTGQVRTPGFFVLPAEALVSDAIMAAGGPLPTAKLAAARVERGPDRIWEGAAMRDAVQHGLTLDQMSLRAGDQIHLPAEGARPSATLLRAATTIPAAVLAVVGLIRVL